MYHPGQHLQGILPQGSAVPFYEEDKICLGKILQDKALSLASVLHGNHCVLVAQSHQGDWPPLNKASYYILLQTETGTHGPRPSAKKPC